MNHIGIDPGGSGAIACISTDRDGGVEFITLSETEADVAEWLRERGRECSFDSFCLLEKVHSMPKQGVASSFKFGASYGFCRGLLIGMQIPFETVTPASWQKEMSCRTGGDKNVTKRRAQELFPMLSITHANADAILLAELCRRNLQRTRPD